MNTSVRPSIQEFQPSEHGSQLRSCIVELQEFERSLEPALPAGEAMADAYLTFLLEQCERRSGRLFVAEVDQCAVGFIGILANVLTGEPDEDPTPYAYITDVVVLPSYRRRGIGRALVEYAEDFARTSGASFVRVGVLAKNDSASRLYRTLGFSSYHVQLTKKL